MGPLAAFSIKCAIVLTVMYAVYMLALHRLKNASLRRATLIGIYIISFVFSLCSFSIWEDNLLSVSTIPAIDISTLITHIHEDLNRSYIYDAIAIAIIGGMVAMTIITLAGIISMSLFSSRSRMIYSNGFRLKVVEGKNFSPFCFCSQIYISEADYKSTPDMILTHEISHIQHMHFIDLIIGKTMLILQWWNPLAWLMIKELQQIHEYQADHDVIRAGYNRKEYQYILLSRTIGKPNTWLASGLRHTKLKNRLKMLNREESGRKNRIAILLLLPGIIMAPALLSLPVVSSTIAKISASELIYTRDANPKKHQNQGHNQYSGNTDIDTDNQQSEANFKDPMLKIDGVEIQYSKLGQLNPNAIKSITVHKDDPANYPDGLIEIETKFGENIYAPDENFAPEKIKVVGYGTELRKQSSK